MNIYARIETIVALATLINKGALALIRLSGEHVRKITDNCSTLKSKNIVEVPTHTIHYGTINEHDGKIIGSVLFLLWMDRAHLPERIN